MLWENWYKSKTDIDGKYTELESKHILTTLNKLHDRILERFPKSGLSSVCAKCIKVAAEVDQLLRRIEKPIWFLRGLIWVTILLVLAIIIGIFSILFQQSSGINGWADILQASEAGVNDLNFLAIAIWFIDSLEKKAKRKAVLKSLHRLRSMAHVVDMHQLTKDPVKLIASKLLQTSTASSPERSMSAFELSRYLDYCSEMLSLISKMAALHALKENDSIVLEAVNDIEQLADGLSSKIWQKLSMLDNDILKNNV